MKRIALITALVSSVSFAQPSATLTAPPPPPRHDAPVRAKAPSYIVEAIPGVNPPPGVRVRTTPRFALVGVGAGVLVTGYVVSGAISIVASAFLGLFGDRLNGNALLGLIPLVGPLFATNSLSVPFGVALSAVQFAGAGVLVAGLLFPRHEWVLPQGVGTVEVTPTGMVARF